ncbi:MAG: PKD domain-containing protein, partial [Thermoplasmata archaeon]|nr:PKD domain-containing protein [Thermoplasmata archaeon]
YDPPSQRYVLFGGRNATGAPSNDTWEFAYGNWTDLTPNLTLSPSPRWNASMAWDAADAYVLLFGGENQTAVFNDTWQFNGTAWSELAPARSPPPDFGGRIVDDLADHAVELFGGSGSLSGGSAGYNFTWNFTAGNWTNITGTVSGTPPDPRIATAAAYDEADAVDLLYGGSAPTSSSCSTTGYTWTFANGSYRNLSAALLSAPPAFLVSPMLAYDSAYAGVLLFGGALIGACGASDQTWIFHAGAWFNLTGSYGPPATEFAQLAANPTDDSALLFSGETKAGLATTSWNFTPALAVSASASTLHGIAPLSVDLNGSVTGFGPLTYTWSFGDGSPNASTLNTTHTYPTAGTYRPTLWARDGIGRVRSARVVISVFDVLTANASAYPSEGDAPLNVSFSARTGGGDPPVQFAWAFGDGGIGANSVTTHTYFAAGTYPWSVSAMDALGDTANFTGVVVVQPALAVATFNVSRLLGVAPFTVYGNVSPINGTGPYTATWSFGDATPATIGDAVSHSYSLAGTFEGHVTVSDAAGTAVVRTFNVTSVAPMVVGIIATPPAGAAPLVVEFSAQIVGGLGPFTYNWGYGVQGLGSTTSEPSYTYLGTGTFVATLQLRDSSGQQVLANASVTVVPPLHANVTPESQVAVAPGRVNWTVVPEGGLAPYSVAWSFGDGTAITAGVSILHTYARAGTYALHATVSDAAGDSVMAGGIADVVAPLEVGLTASATVVSIGSTVSLEASVVGGAAPFLANWSGLAPGCPTAPTALTVTCTPTLPGTYHVLVAVRDGLGERQSANTTLIIALPGPPPPASSAWVSYGIVLAIVLLAFGISVALYGAFRSRRPPKFIPDDSVIVEPPRGAPHAPTDDELLR